MDLPVIHKEFRVLQLTTDASIPMQGRLTYNAQANPFEIVAEFFGSSGDEPQPWPFDRYLLVHGLYRPMGRGAVQIFTESKYLFMRLTCPEGQTIMRFDWPEANAFVCEIQRQFQAADAAIDWDQATAELLA